MSPEGTGNKYLPYRSRFATVAGYQMHYLDEGEGPVLLLVHGNPTWCYYYRNLIGELKDHFRVIAPDCIGMGLSEHPTDSHFRASDRVAHLQEFVECLGLNRFSLGMHDWGGPIGTGLAVRDPGAIEKLIYLNTTLTETEALPSVIKLAATPFIGKFLTKYTKWFLRLTTKVGVWKRLDPNVCRGYYFPYQSSARRTAIWDFVDDIPFDASHPSYAEMLTIAEQLNNLREVPVQIIWGLRDICFHREMLNKVASHFPQASILEIPDASHLVLEDAPELTASTIRNFLLENGEAQKPVRREAEEAPEKISQQNALYQGFSEQAEQLAHSPASIEPLFLVDSVRYSYINFQELRDRINKYQRGLTKLGLRAGDKVLMLVPAGTEFLALSYAVMGRGAIPVFIDPGIGKDNLLTCITDMKPDVLIGSARAQLLRLKKRQLLPELKFHLTASDWLFTGGPNLSFLKRFSSQPLPPAESTDTAFIAFTSGATGLPKGVVFTNEMIKEQLRIFSEVFGLESGKKDLPLLPIFSLFHLASGICSVFPPIDPARPLSLAPNKVLKVVHDLQVDYSFGSPTLWNKIAEYCVRSGMNLGSLRKVLMAGAPVPKSVIERVEDVMLKGGEAYTPYGATEVLPVTFVSGSEIRNHKALTAKTGECGTFVGSAVEGVELRVIRAIDGPIKKLSQTKSCAPREIGEVLVKGKNVSPLYLYRDEATELAKIPDEKGFWHRMGDMGYLDKDGRLYFCGRKAHMVQAPERPYYSVPVETVFNEHPSVRRSALVSLGENQTPGVVIEPHPQSWPDSEAKKMVFIKELRELGAASPVTTSIQRFFFHTSFPVDARHNAKIYRDQLSEWVMSLETLEYAA